MIKPGKHFRKFAAVLAALSVLLLGLNHGGRMQPLDPDLAAYVLAGGNPADLCLGDGSDPGSHGDDCPDCNLCKTIAFSPPQGESWLRHNLAEQLTARDDDHPRGSNDTRGPPVRGPPSTLV